MSNAAPWPRARVFRRCEILIEFGAQFLLRIGAVRVSGNSVHLSGVRAQVIEFLCRMFPKCEIEQSLRDGAAIVLRYGLFAERSGS